MPGARKNVCSSAAFVLFSVYIALESYRLGLGTWKRLGPGYFPFVASVALGIISLSLLIKALLREFLRQRPTVRADRSQSINWRYIALTVAAMLMYVAIFDGLGFIPSTFLIMAFLVRAVGRAVWRVTIITALSITIASYLLFEVALDARLPQGIFEKLF